MTFSRVVFGLVIIVWATIYPERAEACSCRPEGPPNEALQGSAAVFAGRALAIEIRNGEKRVRFLVLRAWKGDPAREVIVRTRIHEEACGFNFTTTGDNRYLVYAGHNEHTGTFSTGLCGRTRRLADAGRDLAELGEWWRPPLSH